MALGRFHKMHGLGNDFVIIDARATPVAMHPARAAAIADRRHGIGCDQVIIIEAASDHDADIAMRIFNADGGEVSACGNASRCVVALLDRPLTIATPGGLIRGAPNDGGGIAIDMGEPRFAWQDIPLAHSIDTRAMPVGWDMLERPDAINVGNPHVVFFVADADAIPLDQLGPVIEHDPLFPERVNVSVASVAGDAIHLRVWERGTGLTRACGTGACATAIAAIRRRLARSPVTVHLPGGPLTIGWTPGGTIIMTGPATHVFTGEADWAHFG